VSWRQATALRPDPNLHQRQDHSSVWVQAFMAPSPYGLLAFGSAAVARASFGGASRLWRDDE
jgi:hypothetical protein